jgi:N-methylhydantoinase B
MSWNFQNTESLATQKGLDETAAQTLLARLDPYLISVISSRLEAVIREMSNTVMKASRSAVIKNARDLSCGLLTYDHRQLCVEEGIPIHISALDLTTRAVSDNFDDVSEGDAYVNNCSYTGGTHHADVTVVTPVFCDGEPMFWTLARSHHADIGAPEPSTYLPYAATVYQEGLNFPCVRFQENFKDRNDWIRFCKTNIRVSNVWYGDYRAQIGACRGAEKRLKELVQRYGKGTIKAFIEAWMIYGEQRMITAIRALPAGSWTHETRHDPVPGVADEGVPVRVTVTIDPVEATITVDARDNIDCVPGGINLSEACATGSCRIGVYHNLDDSLPHNAGSDSRIKVLLRDGCVVGRPTYPAGTSLATTNVNDRLVNAVQACFAQLGEPFGLAEGAVMQQSGMAVISGNDRERGGQPYISQVFVGYGGGPGLSGYDGWVTYLGAVNGAMIVLDSIEIDESMYPIVVSGRRIEIDSAGAGEWDGAPGMAGGYRPIGDELVAMYSSDGELNAPQGVRGGGAGITARNWKRLQDGRLVRLPAFHKEVVQEGETIEFRSNGGGGYGDPRRRNPESVAKSANRGWLSVERARAVYGVALVSASNGIEWVVDTAETTSLRAAPGRS